MGLGDKKKSAERFSGMPSNNSYYGRIHAPAGDNGKHNAILYGLDNVSALTRESESVTRDGKTAFARVYQQGTTTEEELAEKIAQRLVVIDPKIAKIVIESLIETCADELREGRTVTFRNGFKLGVSIAGRLDPTRPIDARQLPLSPWVRFSSHFKKKINAGAKLVYREPYLPTVVKVEGYYATSVYIELIGKFRNVQALTASIILEEESSIECSVALNVAEHSTRHIGSTLVLRPVTPLPKHVKNATVHLTWNNGVETKSTTIPIDDILHE